MTPENPREAIGLALQEVRRRRGVTQKVFATTLGCSQASLSRWEMGKGEVPFRVLCRLTLSEVTYVYDSLRSFEQRGAP